MLKNKIKERKLESEKDKIIFDLMKVMAIDLTEGNIKEIKPVFYNDKKGIYIISKNDGKKFWCFKELLFYYRKKYREYYRL